MFINEGVSLTGIKIFGFDENGQAVNTIIDISDRKSFKSETLQKIEYMMCEFGYGAAVMQSQLSSNVNIGALSSVVGTNIARSVKIGTGATVKGTQTQQRPDWYRQSEYLGQEAEAEAWETIYSVAIAQNVAIGNNVYIEGTVSIGKKVSIGDGAIIIGNIKIEDNMEN
ncbi:MAG: hypothetical protein KKD05_03365 [Candidatus Omnitrophica bacterium]|nr:hypothetical protein [Candidatus Omnitrophota bacterium]